MVAENRLVARVMMAMSLPIVATGMIGPVSAVTSNVIDRTRGIGILCTIGAKGLVSGDRRARPDDRHTG